MFISAKSDNKSRVNEATYCGLVFWNPRNEKEEMLCRNWNTWFRGSKPCFIFPLLLLPSRSSSVLLLMTKVSSAFVFVRWLSNKFRRVMRALSSGMDELRAFWQQFTVLHAFNFIMLESRLRYCWKLRHFFTSVQRLGIFRSQTLALASSNVKRSLKSNLCANMTIACFLLLSRQVFFCSKIPVRRSMKVAVLENYLEIESRMLNIFR